MAAVMTLGLLVWSFLLFGGAVSEAAEPVSSLEFLTTESTISDLTLEQMQQQEAVVQGVWWFEKMVLKGGFQHYLLISDPELIEQLRDDLQTLSALESKDLLDEALAIVYNSTPEPEREKRALLLSQIPAKKRVVLQSLQQKFIQQQPLLQQRIADYLRP